MLAALIFLVALNLRPAIAAVGPVLVRIGNDLDWGEGTLGMLASVGPLAFGALAELTGGRWTAPLILFTTLACAQCGIALLAGRGA